MHMQRKLFFSPRKGIYLPQNSFSSYVYLKDIYKTLKGIEKIQFVSKLTNLVKSVNFKFHGNLPKEKLKLSKLEY